MNLPNQLTVSRFVLTGFFLVALLVRFPFHETAALILFVAASITDYFDGSIARSRKLITNFGILMDPLADKILVCSAFIAFVELKWMPAWMVIVMVARELAITGLRLLAASKNLVLAAEGFGKHKTVSQIVCISAILISMAYPTWGGASRMLFEVPAAYHWIQAVTEASQWAAVVLTLTSGSVYLRRNRAVYLADM
ncbi:MAG: CDP-diacylglycerol--glycerol-3-phosphate 3-phosphatidyltransferase [Verrucomicrobiales bacterium]|nr:CDP-diacylglycerol--glycerol-3-phosphate 3-phosphatidyltransferase [Verrucomicrobiales bacterium]